MPLFSIAATTYNHAGLVRKTLESVLKQTIQDFEVIIVDDGSTDGTKEEILSVKDERIKYVYQKPSGLPAAARNRSIKRCSARYIALLDGDDIWFPQKLEKTLEMFKMYPETDITCHDFNITGKGIHAVRRSRLGPYPEDMYGKLLLDNKCLAISTTVLKREVFFKQGFWFDEDMRLFSVEDYDFWLRLAKSGKFKFRYLPEVLAEHVVSKKGNTLNHIETNAVNALYLFDKNAATCNSNKFEKKMVMRKKRASVMRGAGLSYNYKREYAKSMSWFIKAIQTYPFNKNGYIGLVLSLLRIRLGRI